ncbi:MAG: ArnT family glycosyltransferase, partial [Candidatus Eisenbacteria bacterium]
MSASRSTTPATATPPGRFARLLPVLLLVVLFASVYAADLGRVRMLMWDEAEYAELGRSVLHGEGYRTYVDPEGMRLPMVPLLAAGSLAVAPHAGDTGLRVVALVCMLLALVVAHRGATRAADPPTALAATLLLGAMPMIQVLATLILSEGSFLVFFTAAVWWFHDGLEGRSQSFLACAVAVGLAALTRYVAWLFVPVALLMMLARTVTLGPGEVAKRTFRSRVFLLAPLVTVAVIAPWLVREALVFHDPFEGFRDSLDAFGGWNLEPWSWYLTRLPLTVGWPALIAAILGLVVAVRERGGAAMTAAIVCVVVIGAHSRFAHKEDRYVSSMMPFLATLGGIGLTRLVAPLAARVTGERAAAVIAATLAVIGSLVTMNGDGARRVSLDPAGFPSFVQAMDAIRSASGPRDQILGASGPLIRWYADRPVRPFPDRLEGLPDALSSASWVVFVNYERMQPDWAAALTHRLTAEDAARGDVRVFRSGPYQTVIARA